jgi:two-component system OmpR family response regulator
MTTARGLGQRVLVVVDEPGLADLLPTTFELAGYEVGTAGTGTEMMARISERRFDLVVVDATMSSLNHLAHGRRPALADLPPVLFLTTCEKLDSLLPRLGAAGEDYVTKPFRITEILARMQVLLRGRRAGPRENALCHGDLVLDDSVCQAWRGARPLDLTPGEYRLLRHLIVNAGRVLGKEQIAQHVWGEFRGDNAMERLLSRLRHKVDLEQPALIHTHRGFGYRLGTVKGRPASARTASGVR